MTSHNLTVFLLLHVVCILTGSLAAADDNNDPPDRVRSFEDLLGQLDRDSVLHQAISARKVVRIPTRVGDKQTYLEIRWRQQDGVVQFAQILPLEIAAQRMPAMETGMARINFAMSVPGVELDHKRRLAAYRLSVPFKTRGGITADELRAYIQMTHASAQHLIAPFRRIAEDAEDPIDVIDSLTESADRKGNLPSDKAAGDAN